MSIGLAGLGLMGHPIGTHLAAHHGDLLVWNRSDTKPTPEGATRVATAADLGRQARVVHLSVLDTTAVEQTVFGPNGILSDTTPGGLIVDHSTISAVRTCEFVNRAKAVGWDWVDAPVSGGSAGAIAGELTVFVGATPDTQARALAAIAPFASRMTVMGPPGAGQATKATNQMMVGGIFALLSEAAVLAQSLGVDAALLPDAMAGGFADSALLQRQMGRMVTGPDAVQGTCAVMTKDLDLVADLFKGLPQGSLFATAHALWHRHLAEGHGDEDWVSIIETSRKLTDGHLP